MTRVKADSRFIEMSGDETVDAEALERLLEEAQNRRSTRSAKLSFAVQAPAVVIGTLTNLDALGQPHVRLPDEVASASRPARTTVAIDPQRIGDEVVLTFENGDRQRPIILGMLLSPPTTPVAAAPSSASAVLDDDVLELSANREITLRCGEASITLTRAGKVIIRGAYLLSRSSGVNRIKGGSVQIN